MEFMDGDGNIIMARAVRPIIDLKDAPLGSKKGANKQNRYGNLYIRDYETHYSVHMDTVDPLSNPLGHLLVDTPESLAGSTAALIVGRRLGTTVYIICKKGEGNNTKDAAAIGTAVLARYIAGSAAGNLVFNMASSLKKKRDE
ncbi:MAG: hypothetical protein ACJ70M_05190 [Nitrososphaera sp.]